MNDNDYSLGELKSAETAALQKAVALIRWYAKGYEIGRSSLCGDVRAQTCEEIATLIEQRFELVKR